MDYDLGDDAGQLRQHLRELISNNVPADFLGACTEDPQDLATTETFCKLLAVEGLLALAWPKEHGGGGGSVWHQTVLREEMWAQHEPRGPQYMGINWVGPALMRYGTVEQKAKHLAAIASGDVIWCQGFSEPEAGSDLASLRTRAVPDGDGWRINGQKVWTSYAADGVLVRAGRLHPPRCREVQAAHSFSDPHGPGGFHRPPDRRRCWVPTTSTRCSWTTCRHSPAMSSARWVTAGG